MGPAEGGSSELGRGEFLLGSGPPPVRLRVREEGGAMRTRKTGGSFRQRGRRARLFVVSHRLGFSCRLVLSYFLYFMC